MEKSEIKHIADIAQIEFTEEELEGFKDRFTETLELVDRIKAIDTDSINPVFQVNDSSNNLRQDVVVKSLDKEAVFKNSDSEKYGYFKLINYV